MSSPDILAAAAGSVTPQSSGPIQFAALRSPLFDSVTNRTYQLAERVSDHVPFCVSCAGNHSDALSALNTARKLSHERAALKDSKRPADVTRREAIPAEIKALRTVAAERTDRAARMMMAYAEAEDAE